MIKVVTILGARPQFIKSAPVSKAFLLSKQVNEVVIHTGQHYDQNMSEVFFSQMKISKPAYMLNVNAKTHGDMTGRMLVEIEKVLFVERPDYVLVYGDTNSTLAGALAACKLKIPIAHVESGLRSYDMNMPEEINRILTDRVSKILFCPTKSSEKNLLIESFLKFESDIVISGDVMYDAALMFSSFPCDNILVEEISNSSDSFVLATIHREENTENEKKLRNIFSALDIISDSSRVIFPLHPRTKKYLEKYNIKTKVEFIDPVGYIEMLKLLKSCSLVITDSGGLQKESYFFRKFCLIARDSTEWSELVECGFNFLVGSSIDLFIYFYKNYFGKNLENNVNIFGDGESSEIICRKLIKG